MRIYEEEIFGPVLCIVRVNTLEEAVQFINRNPNGNGVSIFTQGGGHARFFLVNAHIGFHIIEDGWADKVTAFIARHFHATTIQQEAGTFLYTG